MACGTAYTLEQLNALKQDYADLVSGNKARIVVDQNGERVEFSSANASRLYALIQEISAELCPAATPRPNRPMRFIF